MGLYDKQKVLRTITDCSKLYEQNLIGSEYHEKSNANLSGAFRISEELNRFIIHNHLL